MTQKIFYKKSTKPPFTKKRIALLICSIFIFVLVIALVFWMLKINIHDILNLVSNSFKQNPIMILWVFLIFCFPVLKCLYIIAYIRPRIKKMNINISMVEYMFLSFKVFLLSIITPFASGAEPYIIYWMTSRGVPLKKASMISLINAFYSSITDLIITIPSFIYISVFYNQIAIINSGLIIYWFLVIGLSINIIALLLFILLGFSKRIHLIFALISNWILKKIKKKFKNKEEIYEEYITKSGFRKEFIKELKAWKVNFWIIIAYTVQILWQYATLFFTYLILFGNEIHFDTHSFFTLFNIVNVSLTASNFVPIPGGEGTIQIAITVLSSIFNNYINIPEAQIVNAIGLWKILTTYIPLGASFGLVSLYYLYKINLMRKVSKVKKDFNI